MMAKIPAGVGPRFPQVVVLVGATGDLSRRKLLPGLFHLASAGFIPACRIVGVSLDNIDADGFRALARAALNEFSARPVADAEWEAFAKSLDYVPIKAGPEALKAAVDKAEATFEGMEGKLYRFKVTAFDDAGSIGEGEHLRAVIATERLLQGAERRRPG